MKIAPIKFALLSIASLCGHHVTSRNLRSFPDTQPTVHCASPHPPCNSRKRQHYKSIYKLWQASGRRWKWTMADEGYWKTFSFAGVGSGIISLFSWHRKPNSFFCVCMRVWLMNKRWQGWGERKRICRLCWTLNMKSWKCSAGEVDWGDGMVWTWRGQ